MHNGAKMLNGHVKLRDYIKGQYVNKPVLSQITLLLVQKY